MPGYFLVDGTAHVAALAPGATSVAGATVAADGDRIWVHLDGRIHELVWQDALSHFAEEESGGVDDQVRAPMPGTVLSVAAAAGDTVERGAALMVIESMKLETVIRAPRDGAVESVGYAAGDSFERDAVLVTMAAADAT